MWVQQILSDKDSDLLYIWSAFFILVHIQFDSLDGYS